MLEDLQNGDLTKGYLKGQNGPFAPTHGGDKSLIPRQVFEPLNENPDQTFTSKTKFALLCKKIFYIKA
jgi:hypothetical protein